LALSEKAAHAWRKAIGGPGCQLAVAWLDRLEGALWAAVPECGPLTEAAQYLISAGGRRMRPLVTLAACQVLGGEPRRALPLAVAVELVHTASLLHDDILDGSPERRGRPAVHVKFGRETALLAGDMLYFAAMSAAEPFPGAVGVLNAACRDMCLGEVTEQQVEAARLKGGSLFRAAAQLGALGAGADERSFRAAGRYGELLGTAYQLRDDVLDGEGVADGQDLVQRACWEIRTWPDSPAKTLLQRLAEFAWRRTE